MEVWSYIAQLYHVIEQAEPNPAHRALAELEALGVIKAVITQNIDGLHQKAGSRNVIELHGNSRWAVCTVCGYRVGLKEAVEEARKGKLPRCPRCGGLLKPDAVFFGEPLPRDALEKAFREAEKSDYFLVIGSSLTVHPAAYIPLHAKENGAFLVIVNDSPTPLDIYADIVLRGRAGELVPRIRDIVVRIIGSR